MQHFAHTKPKLTLSLSLSLAHTHTHTLRERERERESARETGRVECVSRTAGRSRNGLRIFVFLCHLPFPAALPPSLSISFSPSLSPPSHLEPPSLSISSSIPSTLLAAAEAVVENKSKWRGHCPNHLAAVGFLLAMHTYVMPCSRWVGTGISSGRGGKRARNGRKTKARVNAAVPTQA